MRRATAPTCSSSDAASTLPSSHPMANASSAPTSRPVRIRSSARLRPSSRGSRAVPPRRGGSPWAPRVAQARARRAVAQVGGGAELRSPASGGAVDRDDDRDRSSRGKRSTSPPRRSVRSPDIRDRSRQRRGKDRLDVAVHEEEVGSAHRKTTTRSAPHRRRPSSKPMSPPTNGAVDEVRRRVVDGHGRDPVFDGDVERAVPRRPSSSVGPAGANASSSRAMSDRPGCRSPR